MKTVLILLGTIFHFVIGHIHHHHDHPPHFLFPYPTFPFFPLKKCELERNYTSILHNYDHYFDEQMRVFYFAHRNKHNEPQCHSKLKNMLNGFNENVFLNNKRFTFRCPKSNNQTEKILTLELCLTEEEKEIMRLPDDEPMNMERPSVVGTSSNMTSGAASDSGETPSNSTVAGNNATETFKDPAVTESTDVSNVLNVQKNIPSNQITLCFRLHGHKIEKCLFDALLTLE